MKPEPLTKEIESLIVSDIEQIRDDIKSGHAFIESYDDVLDILKETLPQKVSIIVKHRVKWLLKEIEKERKEVKEAWHQFLRVKASETTIARIEGILDGLERVEDLIKKAFSGVVEE